MEQSLALKMQIQAFRPICFSEALLQQLQIARFVSDKKKCCEQTNSEDTYGNVVTAIEWQLRPTMFPPTEESQHTGKMMFQWAETKTYRYWTKCISQRCFGSQAISFTASVPETSVSSTNGTVFHTFNPTGAGLSSGP